jgi:hypothetical protein
MSKLRSTFVREESLAGFLVPVALIGFFALGKGKKSLEDGIVIPF